MSDPHDAPDPMDKAYGQAEALLNDEEARAARRARVLAAVAAEAAATRAADAPLVRRSGWGRGGWLAAAGVAGVGVLLASQLYLPSLRPPQPAPEVAAAVPGATDLAVAAPGVTAPAPPVTATPSQAPRSVEKSPAVAAQAAPSRAEASTVAPTAAPPPPVAQAPAAPPAAAPSAPSEVNEIVVTASRIPAPATNVRAQPSGAAADAAVGVQGKTRRAEKATPGSAASPVGTPARGDVAASGLLAERGARLRAAAAAGRVGEVRALLRDGVPVNAVDDAGETALMKSIQADQPAVAELLRRRGASLELENREGVSARDIARRLGDVEMDRALGIER